MKFELDDYNRNIPDNLLIEDLVMVSKKINKFYVTVKAYDLNGKYHSATYVRRFGSWVNALEKAGLEKANPHNYRRKFTDEDLFKNLEDPPSTPHKVKRDKNQEIPQSALHKTKRGINWRLRFIVMKRDNFKCKCGRSPATDPGIV